MVQFLLPRESVNLNFTVLNSMGGEMLKISEKDTCYRRNPAVVCTELDGGAILLDLDTKYYYNLNETALKIWQSIDGSSFMSDVVGKIAEEYEVDQLRAEEGVKRTIEEFHREGLVIT